MVFQWFADECEGSLASPNDVLMALTGLPRASSAPFSADKRPLWTPKELTWHLRGLP